MAIPIKAIPTLYGDEAARLRERIESAESNYQSKPKHNPSRDSYRGAMKAFLAKSKMA